MGFCLPGPKMQNELSANVCSYKSYANDPAEKRRF